jgi:predicted transposase YbfD/YdcC
MATLYQEIPQNYFKESFSSLPDPRRTSRGNFIYSLDEILFLSTSAVVSGCKSWLSIAEFGRLKTEWLRKYYPYKNGTPSHDTISDLFSVLDPKLFGQCFMNWVQSIANIPASEVVALDGKTIRGLASTSRKYPLHIVTAFCALNKISLGQISIEEKSNEIVAIPKLLDLLTLQGCIITTDAMGCQKSIAEKIIGKDADYILQVKDNQRELKQQVKKLFANNTKTTVDIKDDFGHGRIEKRTCEVMSDLTFLDGKEDWKNLKSVIRITSERTIKKTGATSVEHRYYISSIFENAPKINASIRSHWAIENNLHWNLDVIFSEDNSLKRQGNSAENFNVMNKVALGLIENEKTEKKSKPIKQLNALLNDVYREKIMKL